MKGRLKGKVDSNSGMLALLQRNQDMILNGELALICTSLLVSMQLVEGTSRLTALAAALNLWEQRIKKKSECRRVRSTYANAHAYEQGSILRKSKSSRMERLGIKYCNYIYIIRPMWSRIYRKDRSIRPVPHSATLVTKPTFLVAHWRQLWIPKRA